MSSHTSVLLNESIKALCINESGTYLDATFGRGGHSQAILSQLGNNGRLYAVDRDPSAAEVAKTIQDDRFFFERSRFSKSTTCFDLDKPALDGVLLDLGVSSPQLDEADRGFSFMREGALDMRMDPSTGVSAKEFINQADYKTLVKTISYLGEEKFAKQIARKIIQHREVAMITTTKELADLVKSAIPTKFHVHGRHPATKTFQAIRMHVNQELDELNQFLEQIYPFLKKNARLVVISFHSLEDQQVKKFVKKHSESHLPPEIPVSDLSIYQNLKFIGRPIRPSEKEVEENPRSRSSIMRVIERK